MKCDCNTLSLFSLPLTTSNRLKPLPTTSNRQVRERDWCNVITAHEGDPTAYVWRLQVCVEVTGKSRQWSG